MYQLPELEYKYQELEPNIDERTMRIHHIKHHQGYVDKLNQALEGLDEFGGWSIEKLLGNIDQVPEAKRQAVINNGGGHANHSLYWRIMTPTSGTQPSSKLEQSLADLGGLSGLKEKLVAAGKSQFGSGWAWVVVNSDQKLRVISTPNQDSPLMDHLTPILGVDVWEHAYYLNYQNLRGDYLDNFWEVINWDEVSRRFEQALDQS